ncbi:L-2-amino-thiazoline-4-carboxylic acid hydrolase [Pseudonocardia tropica]|uniref:L-2-amino-thiazoline-4-carboxylic acid hydrolase n=1 Tax=Pseudonocardia tropica TaxID=681289 RepID=A0ABV1K216_9PSEU
MSRLPRRRWWRRALTARHGDAGTRLARAVDDEYRRILAARPDPPDRTSRFHVRQSITPALAAYQVLSGELGDPARARAEVQDLVAAQMRPVLGAVALLDRLGPGFAAVRRLNRRLVPRLFPAPGFAVTWRRDDEWGLAFDFTGCLYLDVLRHHGAAELTPVFCHGDRLAYAAMPRSVRFERTGTMAGGASCCDFLLRPPR